MSISKRTIKVKHTIDVKVSGMAYFFGVPVLFAGMVTSTSIVIDAGAAILCMGWLAMTSYGFSLIKVFQRKKKIDK